MKKKFLALASLLFGLILIVGSLAIPAAANNVNVKATVSQLGVLTLAVNTTNYPQNTSTAVNYGTVNPGSTTSQTGAVTAMVQTNNQHWSLTQYTSGFGPGNGSRISLNWENSGTSNYTAMSTSSSHPDTLQQNGSPTAGTSFPLDYQLSVPWTVPQGSYNSSVTYTLALN